MNIETVTTWAPTAFSSSLYLGVHTIFAARMLRRRASPKQLARAPRVSVLKPVAGVDDELRENLESFACLDYPAYELLLGVASPGDSSVPVLRAFLAEHPTLAARLIFTDPTAALNPKVAQLLGLAREAKGDVLVVSDANVRVASAYLRELVATLLRPGVGLVSSVVVGSGERNLGAALDNAQLGVYVAPAVVCSDALFGRAITVGKSMAMRRVDLERVGGFRSVGGVLAEDDVLGQRFRALGYGVEVSLHGVENRNVRCTVSRALDRHTRWAKMRRAIAPRWFAAELLLSPLVVAAAVACVARSPEALRALSVAWALQCLGVTLALRVLRSRWPPWQLVALEPARATLLLASWLRAWGSRRVEWRGNAFRIGRDSVLSPAPSRARLGSPA